MKTKYFLLLPVLLFLVSCSNNKYTKIRDEQHKTFFINGISAIEGKDKVYDSLKEYGFKMEKPEECDLTYVGGDFTYHANSFADSLTEEQASRLTYGLFDNLKGITSKDVVKNDENGRARVFLSWYANGEIKEVTIGLNDEWECYDENKIELNKRLSKMFPHSYIANKNFGYKAYTDDNNVEVYLGSIILTIEKKNPNSKF